MVLYLRHCGLWDPSAVWPWGEGRGSTCLFPVAHTQWWDVMYVQGRWETVKYGFFSTWTYAAFKCLALTCEYIPHIDIQVIECWCMHFIIAWTWYTVHVRTLLQRVWYMCVCFSPVSPVFSLVRSLTVRL